MKQAKSTYQVQIGHSQSESVTVCFGGGSFFVFCCEDVPTAFAGLLTLELLSGLSSRNRSCQVAAFSFSLATGVGFELDVGFGRIALSLLPSLSELRSSSMGLSQFPKDAALLRPSSSSCFIDSTIIFRRSSFVSGRTAKSSESEPKSLPSTGGSGLTM